MKITKGAKIGITAHESGSKMWSNGLYQNAYHLVNILKSAGYDARPVTENKEREGKKLLEHEIEYLHPDNISDYEVIFECVHSLTEASMAAAKEKGVITAGIQYGNEYMIDVMADSIYKFDKPPRVNKQNRDAIFMSPHFEPSKEALSIMYNLHVGIAPYIWSPDFLFIHEKEEQLLFNKDTDLRKISVMESNLYFVKTAHIPMLILEHAHRQDPDIWDTAYIIGAKRLNDSKGFVRFAKLLSTKGKKMFFEDRYRFGFLVKQNYAGLIISHQHHCALNYLQLEAMYLGIPFVHNSDYFKDCGYYYPEFQAKKGAEQLKLAIETHKDHFEETREKERKRVYDFHPENSKNIEGYAQIVEWLLEKRAKENKKSKLFTGSNK